MKPTLSVNTHEFATTLKRYMALSRRGPADIINRKAFFIARGACRLTPKADKAQIKTTLGRIIKKKTGARTLVLAKAADRDMSLAEAIIRARFYRAGLPQPSKEKIGELIEGLINSRMRSIAFLKSGWLPAIRSLDALVSNKRGAPALDKAAVQVGQPKGGATAAKEGWRVSATIYNAAQSRHDKRQALFNYARPALEEAVQNEVASMVKWMEERLRGDAHRAGIKTK